MVHLLQRRAPHSSAAPVFLVAEASEGEAVSVGSPACIGNTVAVGEFFWESAENRSSLLRGICARDSFLDTEAIRNTRAANLNDDGQETRAGRRPSAGPNETMPGSV
jgi:hypothetical protein